MGYDSYCDHYIISMLNKKYHPIILFGGCINGSDPIISHPNIPSLHPNIPTSYPNIISQHHIPTSIFISNIISPHNPVIETIASFIPCPFSEPINLYIPAGPFGLIRTGKPNKYLFEISQYILLPLYSFVRFFIMSFDVIYILGIYSFGVKVDAILGRINAAITLRLLNKGEYRGKCFELCGQGYLSMSIAALLLIAYSFIILILVILID